MVVGVVVVDSVCFVVCCCLFVVCYCCCCLLFAVVKWRCVDLLMFCCFVVRCFVAVEFGLLLFFVVVVVVRLSVRSFVGWLVGWWWG